MSSKILTVEKILQLNPEEKTSTELAKLLGVKIDTLYNYMRNKGISFKRRKSEYLTDEQKQKILKLASPHKRITTIASEIGAVRFQVQNFIKYHDLPYKGKVEAQTKPEYFDWSLFTNDIMFLS